VILVPAKDARRPRPKKRKKSRKIFWLKIASVLCLLAAIVAGAFLIRYYYIFNAIIEQKLQDQTYSAPTEIYAAPCMLFPGKEVRFTDLLDLVRRLGYVEAAQAASDDLPRYQILGDDRLLLHNDSARPLNPMQSVEVTLSGNKIRAIADTSERKALEAWALRPQLLSNLIDEGREKRKFVKYRDLPAVLVNAVLAAEDRRFFSHAGIDIIRIVKALFVDIRQGQLVQGASTLTQQFVKNYFLTPERTWRRKLTDAYMSVLLERRFSKQEIFELWANEVYLGQHGSFAIVGFGEAAKAFFNKAAKDLSLGEAAMLAGIIPAPNRYAPFRHPDRARARRDLVLDRMAESRMIREEERDRVKAEPLEVKPSSIINYLDAPYFVDYVQEMVDERLRSDESAGRLRYKVYTSLDLDLQKAAYEALREGLAEIDETFAKGQRAIPAGTVQASLIAIDPQNGRVLAMIGGRSYGSSQFNRITQSKRQPGSIFKPFVYAAAMETAYHSATPLTPISPVLDSPAQFAFDDLLYEPKNFQEEYLGQVTLRQAVARSLNIATIKFAERVGYGRIAEIARRLGLNEEIQPYPAMAIGSFEVTPLEMARAYTAFANGGLLSELLPVLEITDADNRPVFKAEPGSEQVLTPQVAFMITSLMESVVNQGTGAGIRARGFSLPAAGKTGTSHDGWFAGYTPELLCIVWVGFDDNRELDLQGSRSALPIWSAFMKRAVALRPLRGGRFTVPEDIVSVEIDPTTGYLATDRCPYRQTEYFIRGTEPVLPCYGGSYEHAVGGAPTSIYATPKESAPRVDKNNTPPPMTERPTR